MRVAIAFVIVLSLAAVAALIFGIPWLTEYHVAVIAEVSEPEGGYTQDEITAIQEAIDGSILLGDKRRTFLHSLNPLQFRVEMRALSLRDMHWLLAPVVMYAGAVPETEFSVTSVDVRIAPRLSAKGIAAAIGLVALLVLGAGWVLRRTGGTPAPSLAPSQKKA